MTIEEIESRFKEISNINENLSQNLIKKNKTIKQRVSTNKQKSREFGEVFTPLYLVDIMVYTKLNDINQYSHTFDFCSSFGIFTIRLMRILYNKYQMNVEEWLKNCHTFTEIQAESCAKLVYIFGPNINLYCGDSTYINYANEDERGILFWNETTKKWEHDEWVDKIIQNDIIKNNKDYLTFVFNNYKDRNKLVKFLKSIPKSNK